MNEPIKFKKLNELAKELHSELEKLQMGNLHASELEKMTDASRELYERLVVLRHKAFDNEVKKTSTVETTPAKPIETISTPIAFKLEEPAQPAQVSLIDVIEEVSKQETPPAGLEKKIETTNAAAHAGFNPNTSRPELAAQESLYDKLSKNVQNKKESLAEKLEHHPISDLKKAITLNQRFQFSKELFKGNNQDYEVAIEKLNHSGREDAMKHLSTLRSKYSWSEDNAIASDFISLVERRHKQ